VGASAGRERGGGGRVMWVSVVKACTVGQYHTPPPPRAVYWRASAVVSSSADHRTRVSAVRAACRLPQNLADDSVGISSEYAPDGTSDAAQLLGGAGSYGSASSVQ
jgi:hypothetical protein